MHPPKQIIGTSTGLRSVMQRVKIAAPSDVPVLLHGETGCGKEVIAQAVHANSKRSTRPFNRVNCGAIPSDLIDSELFGHERGAFTGSTTVHRGWFEQADTGSLFLDEVGELSLSAQVRLLRVLQEGEFTRVGGEQVRKCNVRIIAATNKYLPDMVAASQFRQDLYYRLAVFPILIPPLRERTEDFAALAAYFVERSSYKFGLRLVRPTAHDISTLRLYAWPGNIREFSAVVDRAVLLGNGKTLKIEESIGLVPCQLSTKSNTDIWGQNETNQSLETVMKRHVDMILSNCHGRIEGPFGAAKILGLHPSTLRSKIRKWNNVG